MANTVLNSNPFGPTDATTLLAFERSIGSTLPADYRRYLRDHNGGDWKNACFAIGDMKDDFLDLRYLYSLNCGPIHRRLDQNWSLAKHYDLAEFEDQLRDFIAIGASNTGIVIVLNVRTEEVFFFDPDLDYPKLVASMAVPFEKIGSSFDAFTNTLVHEDDVVD